MSKFNDAVYESKNLNEKIMPPMTSDGRLIIMPHKRMHKNEDVSTEKQTLNLSGLQKFALSSMSGQTLCSEKDNKVKKDKSKKDKKKKKNKHSYNKSHSKKTKKLCVGEYEAYKKKGKKKAKKELKNLNYTKKNNNGGVMAKMMSHKEYFRVIKKELFFYNSQNGLYEKTDKQKFGIMIGQFLSENTDYCEKYTSREIDEAYKLMIMNPLIQAEGLTYSINKPYILCNNGVVDLNESCELRELSPEYEFTRYIYANYDESAKGHYFKDFIEFATGGDKELMMLLQEVIGYTFSNYNSLRKAFMLVGPKGTGKSLLLNIITELIGAENVSSINIQDLDSEYNRGAILNSAVNIVSDMPATPIKNELSTFKSLTSSLDKLSGRMPYGEPFTKECNTKLLFGSNEVPKLVGISAESVDAFYDRMIFIPFIRQVSDEKRNPTLVEHLRDERDYIFTWACKGIRRVIKNGFRFSECRAAEKLKERCWASQCPEQVFVKKHIKMVDDGIFESSSEIKKRFAEYCDKLNVKYQKNDITNYMEYFFDIKNKKRKVRIDDEGKLVSTGNPISAYEGIRLK